jgi:hypothetical protein
MTEAEWLACSHPMPMLAFLRERVSDRKLRLAGCAYSREVWPLLGKASRRAVLLGEELADHPVDEEHSEAVLRAAIQAVCRFEDMRSDRAFGADIAYRVLLNDGWYAAEWTIGNWSGRPCGHIIDDIFGNPFRPVTFDPAWRTDTALTLARTMYDARDFSAMPILADALQDVGCDRADILDHCRGPGPHVRGCWVVDPVLSKE